MYINEIAPESLSLYKPLRLHLYQNYKTMNITNEIILTKQVIMYARYV